MFYPLLFCSMDSEIYDSLEWNNTCKKRTIEHNTKRVSFHNYYHSSAERMEWVLSDTKIKAKDKKGINTKEILPIFL